MKKLIGLIAFGVITSIASSQEVSIASTNNYTACVGALVDSGMSASDYGANENHTITWCPEAPETILNLYWVVFNLDANSTISIYDGNSNAEPLIGTYTGTELQSLDITSTNITGCLTVEFVSGAGSVGNFGAVASCGEPCEKPIAIINWIDDVQPVKACIGEELTFNSTYSTAAEGQEIVSWDWNLGDGTTTSGEPIITHTYSQPGLYILDLDIVDSNDCPNQNTIDYQILVSTEPVFDGTTTDFSMCVNEVEDLVGMVEGVQYIAEPSVDFGDGLYIPDDQTQCFYSELTFTSFSPGSEVIDANADILNLFINFEHSYMGDLTITFVCPNGQSLQVHSQGGAGTYLGQPIDNDAGENPGIGWDYYWEPTATNGTWEANAGGTLPAGAYESVQPFSNLNGCPLNGTWEIEVCDLWSIDNGFIFDWSIQFAPYLYPEAVSFIPTFGPECDSTYWTTDDMSDILFVNDPDYDGDCSSVEINPDTVGTYEFVFNAINDFGCHYKVPVDVEVYGVMASLTAGSQQFCGEPLTIEATLTVDGTELNEADCDFTWSWDTLLNSVTLEDDDTLEPTLTQMDDITEFTLDVDYTIPGTSNVCSNSFNIPITTCGITIPNVFSPNGDAVNNSWTVNGLAAFAGSEVYVYDRWGVEMFKDIIDLNDGDPSWDGKIQSPAFGEIVASPGTYYYVIRVKYPEDEDLITVDQYCDCGDGTHDIECCCPCNDGEFSLDCCPNDFSSTSNGFITTSYTGTITLVRD